MYYSKLYAKLILLLCVFVGFTSCSDDDDNDGPGSGITNPTKVKKLTSATISDYGMQLNLTNFIYDDKNKITSFNLNSEKISFGYSDSKVKINYSSDTPNEYILKNGIIVKSEIDEDYSQTFEYKNKNLIKIKDDYEGGSFNLIWKNNSVCSIFYDDDIQAEGIEIEYTNHKCITPVIYYNNHKYTPYDAFMSDDLFLFAYGYFGNSLTPYLIKKITIHSDESELSTKEFSYKFDSDGYVTEMTVTSTDGDEPSYTETSTFTWE